MTNQPIPISYLPVAVVHFAYPLSDDSPAEHRIACMPNMKQSEFGATQYHLPHLHANDPRAATCPACKRTENYKIAMVKNGAK